MNQMMYKKINVNKFLCKTLITDKFYFKNINFFYKSAQRVGLIRPIHDSSNWQVKQVSLI